MKTMVLTIWLLCGTVNYGATMAYFEHEFPTPKGRACQSRGISLLFGVSGPFGILPALIGSNLYEHGFMWTLPPRDAAQGGE